MCSFSKYYVIQSESHINPCIVDHIIIQIRHTCINCSPATQEAAEWAWVPGAVRKFYPMHSETCFYCYYKSLLDWYIRLPISATVAFFLHQHTFAQLSFVKTEKGEQFPVWQHLRSNILFAIFLFCISKGNILCKIASLRIDGRLGQGGEEM